MRAYAYAIRSFRGMSFDIQIHMCMTPRAHTVSVTIEPRSHLPMRSSFPAGYSTLTLNLQLELEVCASWTQTGLS